MMPTAWHTTGPFFPARFIRPGESDLTIGRRGEVVAGRPISFEGRVFDGLGAPVVNAILELWQRDSTGRVARPSDPFKGWGRTWTDDDGGYRFRTVKPGGYQAPGLVGWSRPPHLSLMVIGSGLMRPLLTELFFPGEPLNEEDRQLLAIADVGARRRLLLEQTTIVDRYLFDIHLQGPAGTPFLDDLS